MAAYIADGEFPDDELTDLTYMLESNDTFDELLHDLVREDDGPGTKVRIGSRKVDLAHVVKIVEDLRGQGTHYPADMKSYVLAVLG